MLRFHMEEDYFSSNMSVKFIFIYVAQYHK